MNTVKLDSLPWVEQSSPKGRFHHFRRNLSLALGGIRDVGEWGGGHPFDVEQFRMPPGAANFPLHAHSAQWEFYLITSGRATVRTGEQSSEVSAGSVFVCKPGEAHQIINTGTEDLVYLIVADNPRADVFHYPDTGKWGIKPQRAFFEMNEKEYYEGEE
jgi:uncharacterized cupin superfamily protein